MLLRDRPAVLVYGAAAILMAHVGAFDTSGAAAVVRYPYFLSISLGGGLLGGLLADRLLSPRAQPPRRLVRPAVLIAATVAATTPLVWLLAAWLLEGSWKPSRMADLVLQVAPVIALLVPLVLVLQAKQESPRPIPAEPLASVTAGERAKSILAGAIASGELLAIQAEDHYLRLHTTPGTKMVLMRLSDALGALADADGARTHRSWWVARSAVVSVARGGGRATLTLRNGEMVPVSRTYARLLRHSGWY